MGPEWKNYFDKCMQRNGLVGIEFESFGSSAHAVQGKPFLSIYCIDVFGMTLALPRRSKEHVCKKWARSHL